MGRLPSGVTGYGVCGFIGQRSLSKTHKESNPSFSASNGAEDTHHSGKIKYNLWTCSLFARQKHRSECRTHVVDCLSRIQTNRSYLFFTLQTRRCGIDLIPTTIDLAQLS